MTAVEWLAFQFYEKMNMSGDGDILNDILIKAKQMHNDQMIKFAEFVASYPNKNKNYLGEVLHSKSKYDGAERTIDLLEQYYNETYNS